MIKNLRRGYTSLEQSCHIPVINFEKFTKGGQSDKRQISKELFEIFTEVGFVYLQSPGLTEV